MKVWLRRLLLLLFVLFWLAALLTPSLAIILARNGQVQIGPNDGRHWRLFLLSEADAEGLGLERGRTVQPPPGAPESTRCLQTTVDYWLWVDEVPGITNAADFCQCVDTATGNVLNITSPACR